MMSKNKFLIPGVLAAMVLVVGVFAFMPVQQANTVHFQIIDAINGFPGVTNQDIAEELKDKIKLMVATDTETLDIGQPAGPGTVEGYNIFVEALDENKENVIFNLKEVYLCGDGSNNTTVEVDFIWIENIKFDPIFNFTTSADIKITSVSGSSMNTFLLTGIGCVDIISELADSGRAGAMGLGSDEELVIEIDGIPGNHVNFVKCIAFTPNAAEELICDIQPFFGEEVE